MVGWMDGWMADGMAVKMANRVVILIDFAHGQRTRRQSRRSSDSGVRQPIPS